MKNYILKIKRNLSKALIFLFCLTQSIGISSGLPQEAADEFKTPEKLIQSYLKTLSEISHPVDLFQDKHREGVLMHYANKEINAIILESIESGKTPSEIAEYHRQSEESALIVTENLLNRISIAEIDLTKSKLKFDAILWHDDGIHHPALEFGRIVVNLTYHGKTQRLKFIGLVKYKGNWFFTDGPIGWNEEILSSFLRGLTPEEDQIDWDSMDEESNHKLLEYEEKVLLENVYLHWISRAKYNNVKCETLYYTNKIEAHIIDSTINRLRSSRKFKALNRPQDVEELFVITEAEQTFLINELQKMKAHTWQQDMFPQSKRITIDEVNQILESIKKKKTSDEVFMCSIIYTFSYPILIRDGKFALYLDQKRYFGNQTQLEFSFYLKMGERWERYAPVFRYYE